MIIDPYTTLSHKIEKYMVPLSFLHHIDFYFIFGQSFCLKCGDQFFLKIILRQKKKNYGNSQNISLCKNKKSSKKKPPKILQDN
jgi:hypothetical protein